jgi:hypothetical protein
MGADARVSAALRRNTNVWMLKSWTAEQQTCEGAPPELRGRDCLSVPEQTRECRTSQNGRVANL